MADRLSIEKSVFDKVIPQIDNAKLLGLNSSTSERIDLFLFAMALGVNNGKPTSIKSKQGLIRDTSINPPSNMSMLFSLLVEVAREKNEIDKISDRDEAFEIAQIYANTGFTEIEALLHKVDLDQQGKADIEAENSLIWEFLAKLDLKYHEIFETNT